MTDALATRAWQLILSAAVCVYSEESPSVHLPCPVVEPITECLSGWQKQKHRNTKGNVVFCIEKKRRKKQRMLTVCLCVCFITVKWVEVSNNNIVRGSGERTINRSQNSKVIGPGSVLTYWDEKHDMGEKKPYNSPIIYFNHDKTMTC